MYDLCFAQSNKPSTNHQVYCHLGSFHVGALLNIWRKSKTRIIPVLFFAPGGETASLAHLMQTKKSEFMTFIAPSCRMILLLLSSCSRRSHCCRVIPQSSIVHAVSAMNMFSDRLNNIYNKLWSIYCKILVTQSSTINIGAATRHFQSTKWLNHLVLTRTI